MKQQIQSIFTQLKTISFLKWIDMDLGQLENYDERPAVLFPCALVDISYPNTSDITEEGRDQECDCVVTVRLGFQPKGSTNASAPALQNDLAFSILDNVKSVASALQGFYMPDADEPLSRKSQLPERRDDGLKVYQLTFRCSLTETL